jgi:PhzF family phenazine biosynthesis protein
MSNLLSFRQCCPSDLDACYELEEASYPPDEAATPQRLKYRQEHATPYFRCTTTKSASSSDNNADDDATLVGYICGSRCHAFSHETMGSHDPNGAFLAIHSVVISEKYRRRGYATAMMQDYIRHIRTMDDRPKKIILLAKSHLLSFYVRCGFQVVRPSPITHGVELWFDVEMDLRPSAMIIDAFADPTKVASGNPAAFVYMTEECTDHDWMQRVASEFNLSETAFVWPIVGAQYGDEDDTKKNTYAIRYFTPTTEVALCGHATLASAAALDLPDEITFWAKNDVVLKARQQLSTAGSGPGRRITMSFPRMPVTAIDTEAEVQAVHGALTKGLGVAPSKVRFVGLAKGLDDLFVEITEEAFDSMGFDSDINVEALSLVDCYSRGVVICCVSTNSNNVDFCSRFFAPKSGIAEDPVTGSAHCALAPYFADKLGKDRLVGRQCSKRGGVVECSLTDSGVDISGFAVNAVEGRLNM